MRVPPYPRARTRERLDGRHVRRIERRRHIERAHSASVWHALEHGGRYDKGAPLRFSQESIEPVLAREWVRHRVVLRFQPKEAEQAVELDLQDEESFEEQVQALGARPRLLRRLLEGLVVDAKGNPLLPPRRALRLDAMNHGVSHSDCFPYLFAFSLCIYFPLCIYFSLCIYIFPYVYIFSLYIYIPNVYIVSLCKGNTYKLCTKSPWPAPSLR